MKSIEQIDQHVQIDENHRTSMNTLGGKTMNSMENSVNIKLCTTNIVTQRKMMDSMGANEHQCKTNKQIAPKICSAKVQRPFASCVQLDRLKLRLGKGILRDALEGG